MNFKQWLESFQPVFPYFQQEDPPNYDKIKRFKSLDNYVKAMSKGGRKTENAAEAYIKPAAGHTFLGPEKLIDITQNAFVYPEKITSDGRKIPAFCYAFVHLATEKPANPNNTKYNRPRHRILAYYQGHGDKIFTKNDVFDDINYPIGGLSFIGSYIDIVWIDPHYQNTGLYKSLRQYATKLGITGLEPGDELTSKSFRAAQAKYDWKRTHF